MRIQQQRESWDEWLLISVVANICNFRRGSSCIHFRSATNTGYMHSQNVSWSKYVYRVYGPKNVTGMIKLHEAQPSLRSWYLITLSNSTTAMFTEGSLSCSYEPTAINVLRQCHVQKIKRGRWCNLWRNTDCTEKLFTFTIPYGFPLSG